MNIGNIEKAGQKYISFDIFDTLLYRDVDDYREIFKLTEKKLRKTDSDKFRSFYRERTEAQKKAQSSSKVEATLKDIYACTSYSEEEQLLAMQTETETELEHLHADNMLVHQLKRLKAKGKKILIISDMYLDEETLGMFLEKRGIPYDRLYVSSEFQMRKGDGKLFDYVRRDLKIRKKDILHIGDNKKSDFLIPRSKGIASILYRSNILDRKLNRKNPVEKEMYRIFSENQITDYYEEIGFKCLGPLLYGFCKWIREEKTKENLQGICFLSRDGQIVQKVYNEIYGSDGAPYFLASRRALTVPLLENAADFQEILKIVPYIKREESVGDLLAKLGIYDTVLVKRIQKKYGSNIGRNELLGEKGKEIYHIIEEPMKKNAQYEKECAAQYIEEKMPEGRVGLVDIGWYGTMQKSLQKICSISGVKREFYGLYLGLLKRDGAGLMDASGYIYDFRNKNAFDSSMVFGFNGLIELMFTADHGSARNYRKLESGECECVLEPDMGEYSEFVRKAQEGALKFVALMKESKYAAKFSGRHAYKLLRSLLTSPTYEESVILGDLKFYDMYFEKINQFCGWKAFLMNPKKSLSAFLKSNWKIGYLRKMGFRNPATIYKLINKIKK